MTTTGRLVAAMFVALMLGFGAGELLGPKAAVAGGGSCPYQICAFPGNHCSATANEFRCVFPGVMCHTEVCEEPCDPETPDCEDPPDR